MLQTRMHEVVLALVVLVVGPNNLLQDHRNIVNAGQRIKNRYQVDQFAVTHVIPLTDFTLLQTRHSIHMFPRQLCCRAPYIASTRIFAVGLRIYAARI